MHETEKIERKKNLKKKMSLQNCSNHLLFFKAVFLNFVVLDRRKAACPCTHLVIGYYF